jgi:SAM-dependent methyltransferase
MRLNRKIKNMFIKSMPSCLRYWIKWRGLVRDSSYLTGRTLDLYYQDIIRKLDISYLNRLQSEAQTIVKKDSECAAKYFDYKYWLRYNIKKAAFLGLHRQKGLRILDIGCGPCWFLHTCEHFGHEIVGLDIPYSFMTPVEQWVYAQLSQILSCGDLIIHYRIEPFTSIPIEGKFDLITAFLVCFNNHKKSGTWHIKEWAFFIDDIQQHLYNGGRLFFELNSDIKSFPDLYFYDRETFDLFSSKGTVDREKVLINF